MHNYDVIRTDKAENDLTDIALYIAVNNSIEVANKVVDEMEQSISRLYTMPYSGSKWKFTYIKSQKYRFLVVEKYLIFYHVDENNKTVYIDRIQHGSIAPEHILTV